MDAIIIIDEDEKATNHIEDERYEEGLDYDIEDEDVEDDFETEASETEDEYSW